MFRFLPKTADRHVKSWKSKTSAPPQLGGHKLTCFPVCSCVVRLVNHWLEIHSVCTILILYNSNSLINSFEESNISVNYNNIITFSSLICNLIKKLSISFLQSYSDGITLHPSLVIPLHTLLHVCLGLVSSWAIPRWFSNPGTAAACFHCRPTVTTQAPPKIGTTSSERCGASTGDWSPGPAGAERAVVARAVLHVRGHPGTLHPTVRLQSKLVFPKHDTFIVCFCMYRVPFLHYQWLFCRV